MARGYKTGGRQKGTPNKHPIGFRAQLKAYCDAKGIDPHFFLADIIADKVSGHRGTTAAQTSR